MRNAREILRQKWLLKRTHRDVGTSVGVSVGAVSLALSRAAAAELTWEAVRELDDMRLAAQRQRPRSRSLSTGRTKRVPDASRVTATDWPTRWRASGLVGTTTSRAPSETTAYAAPSAPRTGSPRRPRNPSRVVWVRLSSGEENPCEVDHLTLRSRVFRGGSGSGLLPFA